MSEQKKYQVMEVLPDKFISAVILNNEDSITVHIQGDRDLKLGHMQMQDRHTTWFRIDKDFVEMIRLATKKNNKNKWIVEVE